MLFQRALILFLFGASVMASPIVQRRGDDEDPLLTRAQGVWVRRLGEVSAALLISTNMNLIYPRAENGSNYHQRKHDPY